MAGPYLSCEQGERKAQGGRAEATGRHRETLRWKWSGKTARKAREEGWGTLSTKLGLELVLSGSDNTTG